MKALLLAALILFTPASAMADVQAWKDGGIHGAKGAAMCGVPSYLMQLADIHPAISVMGVMLAGTVALHFLEKAEPHGTVQDFAPKALGCFAGASAAAWVRTKEKQAIDRAIKNQRPWVCLSDQPTRPETWVWCDRPEGMR